MLLEVETPTPNLDPALEAWLSGLFEENLVLDGTLAQSSKERQNIWALRENITESLSAKGFMHKNDISVPIANLEDFLKEVLSAYAKAYPGLEIFLYGHLGDGNFHVSIIKPENTSKEDFLKQCFEADEMFFQFIQNHKGSISAEHGIGLLKKPFLHYSRSQKELNIFRSIKKMFDPKGLLNPGKIIDLS